MSVDAISRDLRVVRMVKSCDARPDCELQLAFVETGHDRSTRAIVGPGLRWLVPAWRSAGMRTRSLSIAFLR